MLYLSRIYAIIYSGVCTLVKLSPLSRLETEAYKRGNSEYLLVLGSNKTPINKDKLCSVFSVRPSISEVAIMLSNKRRT